MASKLDEGRDVGVTAESLPKAIPLTTSRREGRGKAAVNQVPTAVELSTAERAERGRTARNEVPRTSHAARELSDDRDPVGVLDEGTAHRVPEVVPVRYGGMFTSPFAMYRGAAAVMAHDLAS